MFIAIAGIACACAACSYWLQYRRYARDRFADEVRIECDVPGSTVYLNGKRAGLVPVRIFADDREWGGQLVHPLTKEGGGIEGGHGIRIRSNNGWVLVEIEPPADRPQGIVCYGPEGSERAVVRWSRITTRGGAEVYKSIFTIEIADRVND